MVEYRFYDTDITGFADYDIAGSEYEALIDKCFAYCTSFSFYVRSTEVVVPGELEPYRLPLTPSIKAYYQHYGDGGQIHITACHSIIGDLSIPLLTASSNG